MKARKLMFDQLLKCNQQLLKVFGPQTALSITMESPTAVKIFALVWAEISGEVTQFVAETIIDDEHPHPNYDEWIVEIIDTLKDSINEASTSD